MKHLDDDRLLEYALELTTTGEREEVERHLESCAECSARLEQAGQEFDVIGGVRGKATPVPAPVARKSSVMVSLLRLAAVLVCGIAVGYGVATFRQTAPACVEPSYLATSPPASALSGAASDATEVVFPSSR